MACIHESSVGSPVTGFIGQLLSLGNGERCRNRPYEDLRQPQHYPAPSTSASQASELLVFSPVVKGALMGIVDMHLRILWLGVIPAELLSS